jgi:hypothetical protein
MKKKRSTIIMTSNTGEVMYGICRIGPKMLPDRFILLHDKEPFPVSFILKRFFDKLNKYWNLHRPKVIFPL